MNFSRLLIFSYEETPTSFVLRSADVATRQKYANLVKSVKDSGGAAYIFSSMHVSGERECTSPLFFL